MSSDGAKLRRAAARRGGAKVKRLLVDVNGTVHTMSLIEAALHGRAADVAALLADGAHVNEANTAGFAPLYIACHHGYTEVVTKLLAANADVNHAISDGFAPLYAASEHGHADVVTVLLAANADVNKATIEGATPLYIACEFGRTEVVTQLLAANANVDQPRKDGYRPLFVACQEGHTEIAATLLAANADVNQAANNRVTPLYHATYHGHLACVQFLSSYGARRTFPFAAPGDSAEHLATDRGHADVAAWLAANPQLLDPSLKGRKVRLTGLTRDFTRTVFPRPHGGLNHRVGTVVSLDYASGRYCVEVGGSARYNGFAGGTVRRDPPIGTLRVMPSNVVLVEEREEQSVEETSTPQSKKAAKEREVQAQRQRVHRAVHVQEKRDSERHGMFRDPDFRSCRAAVLCRAANAGDEAEVKRLLQAKADVNSRALIAWPRGAPTGHWGVPGYGGCTPLVAAALDGHARVVVLLLDAKASTTARVRTGETALDLARSEAEFRWQKGLTRFGHVTCIALLDPDAAAPLPSTTATAASGIDPTLVLQRVRLVGLSQNDLNGRVGTVVSLNHERGRCNVKLTFEDSDDDLFCDEKVLSVLPSKVELLGAEDPGTK